MSKDISFARVQIKQKCGHFDTVYLKPGETYIIDNGGVFTFCETCNERTEK